MYDYLLPIGTVVQLKDAEKYIMIFGVLQKSVVDDNVIHWDYIGVPYPSGFISSKLNIGFNHDEIENVIFKGFENGDDWSNFKSALEIAEVINEKKNMIMK